MSRLKGNVTPVMSFKVGAGSAMDFGADAVSVEFTDGDGNQVTFSDFASGNSPVQLNATFVLDFAATASFEYFTNNAGATGVTYIYQPSSGAVSQTNPKFTGTLTLPAKPRFAMSAGTDTATYDMSFACDTYTKAIT